MSKYNKDRISEHIKFTDFVNDKVMEILEITKTEFSELKFEAGIKAQENNNKYKSYFLQTGAFWDCFYERIKLYNLQIIVEKELYQTDCVINKECYFDSIVSEFILPERIIRLINKQYRQQFSITSDVKRKSKRVITPRIKNKLN